jgi:hypothetical protein
MMEQPSIAKADPELVVLKVGCQGCLLTYISFSSVIVESGPDNEWKSS